MKFSAVSLIQILLCFLLRIQKVLWLFLFSICARRILSEDNIKCNICTYFQSIGVQYCTSGLNIVVFSELNGLLTVSASAPTLILRSVQCTPTWNYSLYWWLQRRCFAFLDWSHASGIKFFHFLSKSFVLNQTLWNILIQNFLNLIIYFYQAYRILISEIRDF